MAIGVDEIYLSLANPDNGELLTANVYTVDGVFEADGVTLRQLSIGELVMALCLQWAARRENGYDDPVTGQHVSGIIEIMEQIEDNSAKLESLTDIETQIVNYFSNDHTDHAWGLRSYTVATGAHAGESVKQALVAEGVITNGIDYVRDDKIVSDVDVLYSQIVTDIEAKMDEMNSFSQQKMIQLQSQTSKRDQAYDMISNVLKSLNTVQVGIVNNM